MENKQTKKNRAVYESKIVPLVKQITDLCNEHKIPVLMDFIVEDEGDQHTHSLTARLAPEFGPCSKQMIAARVLDGDVRNAMTGLLMYGIASGDLPTLPLDMGDEDETPKPAKPTVH